MEDREEDGESFFYIWWLLAGKACDKHLTLSMKEGLFFEASSGRNKFYLIQKKIWFSHQGITNSEPFQITRVAKDQNPHQQQVGLERIRNKQSDVDALKSIACAAKFIMAKGFCTKQEVFREVEFEVARHVQRNVHAYRIRKVYSIRSQWVY